ncbi:MAG: hypothetical protein ACXAEX_08340 [Promethearchaeota archaeon]|jgi:hypothetical protein
MDLARFLQIYVVQGGLTLFFLYMAYKVLRRGRKSINLYLSSFYLSATIGGIINIIYANLFEESIVYILHFFTYFILCFSMGFLLIFVITLIKPPNQIKFKLQLLILVIYGLLLLGFLFIPKGIIINSSTNWKPNWSWIFFIYSIIVCTGIIILPITYYSIRIYVKFESDYLKKKWKYFLIGIFAYFFLYYGTSFSNTLHNDIFRFIWSLISLPTLISLFLIYYGVGRQLE